MSDVIDVAALAALEVTVPADLEKLWEVAAEVRLLEDVTYGQWGLILWGPDTVVERQGIRQDRADDFETGDLVIGEFRGDAELLMLRCARGDADFGRVMIALPIDRREHWYRFTGGLGAFFKQFVEAGGEKFWELHSED